jgi:hypothetical protein
MAAGIKIVQEGFIARLYTAWGLAFCGAGRRFTYLLLYYMYGDSYDYE